MKSEVEQPAKHPPTKLEDLQVVLTEESEEDLLLKCKMAILDLTEELEQERKKTVELECCRSENEKLRARNQTLENERKQYMRENALLRYFIASLEDKSKRITKPIDVLLEAHKQIVNPQRSPSKASAVLGNAEPWAAKSTSLVDTAQKSSHADMQQPATASKQPYNSAFKQSTARSHLHTSARKYRYLL